MKNLFSDISQSLLPETTCRKTVLKLGADELILLGADENNMLQQIKNFVDDKWIFLVVDESTLSGTQYLNILVETPKHASCQLLFV